ncbi:hypothetical protein GCM10010301_28670 [Streptomyces plicatus]|nr:hypothetical protein GCM10010301_28670 [Streptomyces plicatus]
MRGTPASGRPALRARDRHHLTGGPGSAAGTGADTQRVRAVSARYRFGSGARHHGHVADGAGNGARRGRDLARHPPQGVTHMRSKPAALIAIGAALFAVILAQGQAHQDVRDGSAPRTVQATNHNGPDAPAPVAPID